MYKFNKKLFKPYFNFKKNIIILFKKIFASKSIKKYFRENEIIKIHLGCGGRIFNSWLNCDINLQSDCYLDLNKKLLFKDNSVDYIYSEHVLEHFDYQKCKEIMQECHRVLKLGGVIRTAMPSLNFYLENIFNNQNSEIKNFIAWHKNNFPELKNSPNNMNTMLNFIIGSCGHKYVYTEQTFIYLLSELNFKNIKQVDFNELENNPIARTDSIKTHLLQTMVFEAEK